MNLGSLFISLGVKGSEKAIGSLGAVRDGLNAIVPKSLEAKAGIIGAMYALEQFFSHGADRATTLENMSATLGVSVEKLQLLGNAALESRTPLETVVSTLQNAQLALAKMNYEGGQNVGWLGRFMQLSGAHKLNGGVNPLYYLMQHIDLLPQLAQVYADTEKDVAMRNLVFQNIGLSPLTPALARGNFRPENTANAANAPHTSEAETKRLDEVRTKLAKLNQQIEIGLSKIAAKFGPKMMGDISSTVSALIPLVSAFADLAQSIHAIEGLGLAFKGWALIFQEATTALKAFNAELPKSNVGQQRKLGDTGKLGTWTEMVGSLIGSLGAAAESVLGKGGSTVTPGQESNYQDLLRRLNQSNSGATPSQNVTVNQNFSVSDQDKKGIADSAAKGIRQSFQTNPAQLRHN